ncbi:endonuclease/exonuclease/phosphatase family protein [Labedella endophytica]|uniref:Endonuclease/exonuclease/phosphatase domain-containing protein n=1 Tax=Labedella endophytica TaxID=1523160 RepID=A0A433JMT6_9MICO|nr:endonuclease/exonuclease/phosphatase family protein [Labedella endophytica]RUQ96896.1 hypothetical protein ELQ94_16745 [Labedella endophytica]
MPLVPPRRRRRLLSALALAAVAAVAALAGGVLTPAAAVAAEPALAVSATTIEADATVTITFDAGDDVSATNWIGIYRDGETPGGPASLDWRYVPDATGAVEWGPTARDGWTTSSGAIDAGDYDVYLLHDDGYEVIAGPVDLAIEPTEAPEPEPSPSTSPKPAVDGVSELSVLTFNLWHGGTQIDDGTARIAEIIAESDADVVFTPEKGAITDELAALLGFDYVDATDTGVISRYPIVETATVGTDWTKAVIDVNGTETAVYGGHLEYRWYANYLPRGYGGEIHGDYPDGWDTWDQLDAPVTDVDLILQASNDSDRPEETALVVADAAAERAAGRLAVIGGDFNEPSGEDWTTATADMFDHNGTVIAWPALQVLLDAGFIDSYREKYPDPVTHPGITWSIENPAFDPLELTWTPEADERDRIDFVFFGPDERIALQDSVIVGPQGTIVDGEVVGPDSEDPIVTPAGVWPSDHKAVLSTFSVCAAGCAAAPQPAPSPEPTPDPTVPAPAPTDPPTGGGPAAPGDPGDGSGVDDESPTPDGGSSDDLAVTGAQNVVVGWGIALALLLAGIAAAIVARVRSHRRAPRD